MHQPAYLTQRIHVIYITIWALFWSAIFYASSPKEHYIPYIDCLFMCVSAMTVTGLVSVSASSVTLWQQIILFMLMCMGNIIIVSTSTVILRRYWFARTFRRAVRRSKTVRARLRDVEEKEKGLHENEWSRLRNWFGFDERHNEEKKEKRPAQKLNASMVKRVEGPAIQVNPTGHLTTIIPNRMRDSHPAASAKIQGAGVQPTDLTGILQDTTDERQDEMTSVIVEEPKEMTPEEEAEHTKQKEAPPRRLSFTQTSTADNGRALRHTRTIEPSMDDMERREIMGDEPTNSFRPRGDSLGLHRTMTRGIDRGMGGFPAPWDYISSIVESRQNRVPTMRYSTTFASQHLPSRSLDIQKEDTQFVPYLTFDAEVTGNSHFQNLTVAQKNELGGLEYRSLAVLSWMIPMYWIGWLLLSIVIVAPYLASPPAAQYRAAIQDQPKPPHNTTWEWIFQSVSALTNTGMSLVDDSMELPLGKCYMMLFPTMWLILVGNTAFPICLRAVLWVMQLMLPRKSAMYETLRFLLDHPRRCFIYLFRTESTLFLLATVLLFTISDWFFAMVLDLPMRHDWPSTGTWIVDCLFQSIATRAAGFQTMDITDVAPALQMYQVIMMYVSAFPLAMAVRSTNVYEERSLGVYGEAMEREHNEQQQQQRLGSRFLEMHIRNQIMYDLWFVMLALFILCVCEKSKIQDTGKYSYVSVFAIIYEMVSAYGTVGLSFGSQVNNSSLSGDFNVISKLVIIALMLRGRHRGLPVAIDRAVMLPRGQSEHDALHDIHRQRTDTSFSRTDTIPRRTSSIRTVASKDTAIHRVPRTRSAPEPDENVVLDTIPEGQTASSQPETAV